jgi:hypothetical protein
MSQRYHSDWGILVTLSICHHFACPCCDGSGEKDAHWREPSLYSVLIVPGHSRAMITVDAIVASDGVASATYSAIPDRHAYDQFSYFSLYDEELKSLVDLISEALTTAFSAVESKTWEYHPDEGSVFRLTQNSSQFGEYSLNILGPGFDDVLLVDGNELRAFLNEVAKMKESEEAYRRRLAEEEDREREAKLRMREKTLDEIEDEAKRASPFVAQDEQDSQVVRVLLAAAFFVGPDVKRLVYSTGYSRDFIAEISIRLHDSGLWADGEVCVGHWFDDEFEWSELGLRQDCLVASGDMVKCCCGQNGALEYCSSGRPW